MVLSRKIYSFLFEDCDDTTKIDMLWNTLRNKVGGNKNLTLELLDNIKNQLNITHTMLSYSNLSNGELETSHNNIQNSLKKYTDLFIKLANTHTETERGYIKKNSR